MSVAQRNKKKPIRSAKAKKVVASPTAIHAQSSDGEHHIVGIGNIKVLIIPDGRFWFAQGLDIDYSAQGDSVPDVKRKFEVGLTATIQLHLKMYGNLGKFLRVAPTEAWSDLWNKALHRTYSQVSLHEVAPDIAGMLAYQGINYVEFSQQPA